ncbi:hypothetical protein BH09DEP1_BH09DEP1_2870 [soil metagenome]
MPIHRKLTSKKPLNKALFASISKNTYSYKCLFSINKNKHETLKMNHIKNISLALLLICMPLAAMHKPQSKSEKNNLLKIAILESDSQEVALLLKSGANPNTLDRSTGDTFLIQALFIEGYTLSNSEKADIVALLLKAGARPLDVNQYGQNAYDMAKWHETTLSKSSLDLLQEKSRSPGLPKRVARLVKVPTTSK